MTEQPVNRYQLFQQRSAAVTAATLLSSGATQAKSDLETATAAAKAPKKTNANKRPRAPQDVPDPSTKRITRSRGGAVTKRSAEEIEEERLAEEEKAELVRLAEQKVKHGKRHLEALSGVTDSGNITSLRKTLKALVADTTFEGAMIPEARAYTTKDEAAASAYLQSLTLRALVKVVPDRIYSLVVHPSLEKDIIFVGDKVGRLGVWDATEAGSPLVANGAIRSGKVGDNVNQGSHWYWEAHKHHTVSTLRFPPHSASMIYSASYDCTLRRTDLNTCQSEEVIDADRFTDEGLLHSFSFTPDGNEIWACDNNGGLIHRDIREPIETTRRWLIDSGKVGCISVNPVNPHLAVTAHLKRSMRIWDLRKVVSMPPNATPTQISKAQLAEYEHGKACSSAYFDPTGTKILSTSYDDHLRIWNLDPKAPKAINSDFQPTVTFFHDNQVGRYVSVFKANWATVPSPISSAIMCASMHRSLDLFSPTSMVGKKLVGMYDPAQVTAVPAITASHPTLPGKYYGGTGAGKISFYSQPWAEEN